jgi:expansin
MTHTRWPLVVPLWLLACTQAQVDDDAAAGARCATLAPRSGDATYYAADGSGNCSFAPSGESPLFVAALSDADYDGARACGSCVRVEGPEGSVDVRIVDRCPGCSAGDIDLSPEAFERIAPLTAGRVAVSWHAIPCEAPGTIRVHFKDGSNPWWTAIRVDRHRHAIAALAYRQPISELRGRSVHDLLRDATAWVDMPRELYNYFVEANGVGEGPIDLRITDIHGHELVIPDVTPGDDVEIDTGSQLPACEPPALTAEVESR